jgi:hypothetical protein
VSTIPNNICPFIIILLIAIFLSTADSEPTSEIVVTINNWQAFGFPQKKFLHPLVSPDDKWIVYHHTDIDWLKQKATDLLFGRVEDVAWKKIYYSKLGLSEKRVVPLPRFKPEHHYRAVWRERWSPDGKILTYRVDMESGSSEIAFVDFTKEKPAVIDTVECEASSDYYFISNDEILCIDDRDIKRKRIGFSPVSLFNLNAIILNFQIGKNGIILWRENLEGTGKIGGSAGHMTGQNLHFSVKI